MTAQVQPKTHPTDRRIGSRPAARPIPVWLPPGGAQFLARAAAPFDECDAPGVFAATIDVREYDPNQALTIGDAVVTFAPAVHYVPAWAMRVAAAGRGGDLAYTGDTGPAAPLAEFFRGAAVVISEATLLETGGQPFGERRSLKAAEAGGLARAAGANILVLTHLWEELGFAAYRRQAAATFPGRLDIARPGLIVEW